MQLPKQEVSKSDGLRSPGFRSNPSTRGALTAGSRGAKDGGSKVNEMGKISLNKV